jgi:hypothetical protein
MKYTENFEKRKCCKWPTNMKKCSPSLAIKGTQIEITLRVYLTPFKIAIINNTKLGIINKKC